MLRITDRNITGQLVFLGTGTSHGVPMIGCGCEVCNSDDPHNSRTRSSVILGLPEGNLLIDTTPELRIQLVRERIGQIDAVAITHEHVDHLFGLDDLRIFPLYLERDVPLYCTTKVEQSIRSVFSYAFDPITLQFPAGGVPRLDFQNISPNGHGGFEPFEVLGATITPIPLLHGRHDVLGFRVGNLAYCTDVKEIPPASFPLLEGVETLILDALRERPHPTHMHLDQAVETAEKLGVRRALFTHICHNLDHASTNARLPEGIELAYDGLVVPLV